MEDCGLGSHTCIEALCRSVMIQMIHCTKVLMIQCSAVLCSAMQCSEVQGSAVQYSTM